MDTKDIFAFTLSADSAPKPKKADTSAETIRQSLAVIGEQNGEMLKYFDDNMFFKILKSGHVRTEHNGYSLSARRIRIGGSKNNTVHFHWQNVIVHTPDGYVFDFCINKLPQNPKWEVRINSAEKKYSPSRFGYAEYVEPSAYTDIDNVKRLESAVLAMRGELEKLLMQTAKDIMSM